MHSSVVPPCLKSSSCSGLRAASPALQGGPQSKGNGQVGLLQKARYIRTEIEKKGWN